MLEPGPAGMPRQPSAGHHGYGTERDRFRAYKGYISAMTQGLAIVSDLPIVRVHKLKTFVKPGADDTRAMLTFGAIAGRCILYKRPLTSFSSVRCAPSGYSAPSCLAPAGRGSTRSSAAPQGWTSKWSSPVLAFFQSYARSNSDKKHDPE